MNFPTAIRTCMRSKYITFKGRGTRSEFWWFFLFWIVTFVLGSFLFGLLFAFLPSLIPFGSGARTFSILITAAGIVALILYVLLLIPYFAASVRRFHDRNLSGWIYVGLTVLTFAPGFIIRNPDVVDIISGIAALTVLFICALPGTKGPNRHGPDPLESNAAEIFS